MPRASPILRRIAAGAAQPSVTYRQSGDRYLLVEYGPLVLDLNLRFRVHALMHWLQQRVFCQEGSQVAAGQHLIWLEAREGMGEGTRVLRDSGSR